MTEFREKVLEAQIRILEEEIQWGIEHPYRGYCGEDDARSDELERLKRELVEMREAGS